MILDYAIILKEVVLYRISREFASTFLSISSYCQCLVCILNRLVTIQILAVYTHTSGYFNENSILFQDRSFLSKWSRIFELWSVNPCFEQHILNLENITLFCRQIDLKTIE